MSMAFAWGLAKKRSKLPTRVLHSLFNLEHIERIATPADPIGARSRVILHERSIHHG